MFELLEKRRSVVAKHLGEPGPSEAELERLLTVAARVPDHGKLAPWRFIVFRGEARREFGEFLAERVRETEGAVSEERAALEEGRFLRAPVVVGVISSIVQSSKIPEWEQVLSCGAVCQNLLVGAHALGYNGQWLTEWYAYDEGVRAALGLESHERIAGFVYLGTGQESPKERPRPDVEALTTHWQRDH